METVTREWTVLTWNLQGQKRTDLDRVAAEISDSSPDVIVLQEIRRPQARRLAAVLGMRHHWASKHNPFRPFCPSRAEGAAILSPHPLTEVDHCVVSEASSKRSYRRRIAIWATVSRPDHSAYRVLNAHLSPHDLRDERIAEARRIVAILDAFGDAPPAVVAGDFNDHEQPEVVATLPGDEQIPSAPTNPSEAPSQRLDHVLVPDAATVTGSVVPDGDDEWAELSDHLPLTVTFTLDWVSGDWT